MQASAGKPISDMRQNENKNEAESVWLGAQVIIGGNAKFRFEDASLYRMVAGAGYCPTLLSPVLPLGLTLTLASCFERLTSPFHMQWCYGLLPSVPQLEVALVLDSSQEAEANCVAAKHTQLLVRIKSSGTIGIIALMEALKKLIGSVSKQLLAVQSKWIPNSSLKQQILYVLN